MRADLPTAGDPRLALRADCTRCQALCCVALAFSRSADFALDKEAGEPCVNLAEDHSCRIHPHLRSAGFAGCTRYDCFGAGQRISTETFAGRAWRSDPQVRTAMFAALPVVRGLHELLWYLHEALTFGVSGLEAGLRAAVDRTEHLAAAAPAELAAVDVAGHREQVAGLLRAASAAVRAPVRGPRAVDRVGADLVGARLRGADLRGVSLRGALLIGADLRGARLHRTDLIGADLRGADLAGADLSTAIFVTGPQLAAADGDRATRLPPVLARPEHWLARG